MTAQQSRRLSSSLASPTSWRCWQIAVSFTIMHRRKVRSMQTATAACRASTNYAHRRRIVPPHHSFTFPHWLEPRRGKRGEEAGLTHPQLPSFYANSREMEPQLYLSLPPVKLWPCGSRLLKVLESARKPYLVSVGRFTAAVFKE